MKADVERMAKWEPKALDAYIHDTRQQIKNLQHLNAAALKAQRLQRKEGR